MDQQLVYCQSIALFPRKEILIFGKPSKLARKIVAFSLEDGPLLQRTLTIRDEKGNYSQEYIALTRDFHDREL
jgi:tRNA1(Val) A37 N6-methylase TrmN6